MINSNQRSANNSAFNTTNSKISDPKTCHSRQPYPQGEGLSPATSLTTLPTPEPAPLPSQMPGSKVAEETTCKRPTLSVTRRPNSCPNGTRGPEPPSLPPSAANRAALENPASRRSPPPRNEKSAVEAIRCTSTALLDSTSGERGIRTPGPL